MFNANASTPIKIDFCSVGNSVMEFKVGSPADSRADETSDLTNIKLYMYDWTITNYNMIKPVSEAVASPVFQVGPLKDGEMKIILSPSTDDNIKIEVELSKETKRNEELKRKEVNCPMTSKITKNILGIEFLDSNGKTIDYYMGLPYEFKYVNTCKVFTWKKEENVSRFIQNNSLSIRVKLSVRYYSNPSENPASASKRSTKMLMKDMKSLFLDRSRFPDLVIKVGGQLFLAHKSVLFTQYPHFAEILKCDKESNSSDLRVSIVNSPTNISSMLKEDYVTLSIPNENADVFLSVLHFIYCGELYVTDTVNDFAVYDFAKKYGVRELSMLLMPSIIHSSSQIKLEKVSYTWYVKDFGIIRKGGFAPLVSPPFKTNGEVDITWNIVLFNLDSQNIILSLQRLIGLTTDVQTSFDLSVCKADGSLHDKREFKHLFTSSTLSNCHPGLMNSVSRFLITPDLLFNDTLAVCCDLVVSNGGLVSELKHSFPGEYPDIDLTYWTGNFQKLWENGTFSDATLLVDGKEFKVHKAILSARSPVFARMLDSDMEEKHSSCVRIEDICDVVMKQALLYIYTGKVGNLSMKHSPELYRTADKYEILDLKTRCADFILQYMDADSACEILILADLYGDENMKKAAKNIICRNSAQALLAPSGFELMTNHPVLAHDILESLSAVYCSLPPQDSFEKLFLKPHRQIKRLVLGSSPSASNSVLKLTNILKDTSIG